MSVLVIPALLISFVPALANTSQDYMLMPRAELLSLPTSGSAWTSLQNIADSSWGSPDLCNQDVKHGAKALAGALVYARTGNSTYYTKARNAIMSAMGTERSDCSLLSIGRQLGSYVLAADFIKLSGSDDTNFRSWLDEMRTRSFTFHSRWQVLVDTHADANNNWGAFVGASRIAASLYLGDGSDVATAAKIVRGFFGDRAAHSGFRTISSSEVPWTCSGSATNYTPINPACTKSDINLDGAIVGDVYRDDLGLIWPVGTTGIGYTLESLQGLVVQAELLQRNGYSDAWSWSDSALRRAAGLITRNKAAGGPGWNYSSVSYHVPWLLNFRYNLGLPTVSAVHGRMFGYTDWLYGGRSASTVVTSSPTPTATPTPGPTATPTAAPTATPTAAPTATATPTPSPTATATTNPTPSPTVSLSPSPSASPSPTPSASPSPTPSASPSPSPSATPSPSASPTPSPSPSPSPSADFGVGLRSLTSATAETNSIVLQRPAGTVAGDVLVAVIDMRGNMNHKIDAPDGWTLVRRDGMRNVLTKAIYVRTAKASEPAGYKFAFNRTQTVNGILMAFSGVDGANPVAGSSGTGTAASKSIHAAGVTAPPDGGYLVGLFATGKEATVTPPQGMTERVDMTQSSARYYLTSEVATQSVASGGTGNRIAVATASSDNIGQLLVLRPMQ